MAKLILVLTEAQQAGLERLCEKLRLNENQVIHRALSDLYRSTIGATCPRKAVAKDSPADSPDVDEALAIIDEIQGMVDEVPERGQEFAESVRDKAAEIGATIERDGRVTDGQMTALENMRDGLERWIN